jgi:hypothetical protein
MSNQNTYLLYTEYYLISGAYHIMNVVNDVLSYSAFYSDNFKGYLHSKVVSKKIILNDVVNIKMTNNVNNNNDEVDEDGFVIIKMRKQKIKNKCSVVTSNSSCIMNEINCENSNVFLNKEEDHCIMGVVEELIERLINDVINDVINKNDVMCRNEFNE